MTVDAQIGLGSQVNIRLKFTVIKVLMAESKVENGTG